LGLKTHTKAKKGECERKGKLNFMEIDNLCIPKPTLESKQQQPHPLPWQLPSKE